MRNPLVMLRWVALIEAISYLLLLGIAMPLKYGFGMPGPVSVLGMAHGVLFLAMGIALVRAYFEAGWPIARLLLIFVASLVPLWPLFLDRRFPGWIAATPPLASGS